MPETILWHFSRNGQQCGPVSSEALRQMAQSGQLLTTDLVWHPGLTQWQSAGQQPELFNRPPGAPPPLPIGGPPLADARPVAYGQTQQDLGQNGGIRMLMPVGRSGSAIAAGYLGLFSFIILPAPLSLIISIIAIRDIRRHPERHGMGRSIFGLIMGILGTVILAIGGIAFLVGK